MDQLNTSINIADPDNAYQMLMTLHEGCSNEESNLRNAKLILALINHIGNHNVIEQAIRIAAGTQSVQDTK